MRISWAIWDALKNAETSLLRRGPPHRPGWPFGRPGPPRSGSLPRPGGRQRLPGPAQARGTAVFEWNWVDFALAHRGCSVEERDRVLPETADGEVEPEVVFLWGGRVWGRGRGRRCS